TESGAATPVESSNASWPLSFTAEAVTLEGGRSDYASFLAGETLYLLGGRPFEHATTASCFDFQSAGFVPCGGLLPTARTGAAGAVLGGSTWLFGGLRADNALLTEILSAPLSAAE